MNELGSELPSSWNGSEQTAISADIARLLRGRQWMSGRGNAREFEAWWIAHQAVYLTGPVLREHGELTLSEFSDELFVQFLGHQAAEKDAQWLYRAAKRLGKNRGMLALSLAFGAIARKGAGFLWSLVLLGPGVLMVNSYTQPMVTPLAQTASQVGARDLAPAASVIQGWLTDRERFAMVKGELEAATEQLRKTEFAKLSPQQARQRWAEFEKVFFALFLKFNQTLPSHLREGRAAFKDFLLFTPVGLASNLATFDTQYWTHRRELASVEARSDARLARLHRDSMRAAESRIAGTLAAWKLFEAMYPEYAEQPAVSKEASTLQAGYRSFSRTMRFDLYVRQFGEQMDQVLARMNRMLDEPAGTS